MKLTEIGSASSAPNIIRKLGSSGSGEWPTASKRKTKEELKQQRIDHNKQQLTQFSLLVCSKMCFLDV